MVRSAVAGDCAELGKALVSADVDELRAVTGQGPAQSLYLFHELSDESRAAEVDGDVVAMWGVMPDPHGDARNIWMMCSPEAREAPIALTKAVVGELEELSGGEALVGYADARNLWHVRWAVRMGFVVSGLHPQLGVEQRPFYEFVGVF